MWDIFFNQNHRKNKKTGNQIKRKESKNSNKNINYIGKFWKNAEITNGRLAMIGFLALIINYGFFGWIIPGFI